MTLSERTHLSPLSLRSSALLIEPRHFHGFHEVVLGILECGRSGGSKKPKLSSTVIVIVSVTLYWILDLLDQPIHALRQHPTGLVIL
jgi:hypothetical protein|eukprot:COSAG02_NODE_1450_length_12560_cov_3.240109_7_plen_87_part_00